MGNEASEFYETVPILKWRFAVEQISCRVMYYEYMYIYVSDANPSTETPCFALSSWLTATSIFTPGYILSMNPPLRLRPTVS